jgi:integration host factor beta subunit
MTKTDLVDILSEKADLPSKAVAEKAVNVLFDQMTEALKEGQRVNISGFGTFAVSERKARIGRNPKTGEKIQIASSRVAHFKAGKTLKDSLNNLG